MIPLAITGLGIVSPIGVGREAWTNALRHPREARARAFGRVPTVLDPVKIPEARAAEAWDFEPSAYLGAKGLRNFDRLTKFLIVAGKHAHRGTQGPDETPPRKWHNVACAYLRRLR